MTSPWIWEMGMARRADPIPRMREMSLEACQEEENIKSVLQ
jgi:hypothetical protein